MADKRQYKHPQFNLRLPVELKARIEESAKKSGRSMNAEILVRLNLSYMAENDPQTFISSAEEESFVARTKAFADSEVREKVQGLVKALTEQIMTDEYQKNIKALAREAAEKDWEDRFGSKNLKNKDPS